MYGSIKEPSGESAPLCFFHLEERMFTPKVEEITIYCAWNSQRVISECQKLKKEVVDLEKSERKQEMALKDQELRSLKKELLRIKQSEWKMPVKKKDLLFKWMSSPIWTTSVLPSLSKFYSFKRIHT